VIAMGMGSLAGLMFALTFCDNIAHVILVLSLSSIAVTAYTIATPPLLAYLSPQKATGTTFGFYRFLERLTSMFGPLIGGFLWKMNINAPFYLEASLLSIGALIIVYAIGLEV